MTTTETTTRCKRTYMPFIDDDGNPGRCSLTRHPDEEVAAEVGGEDRGADLRHRLAGLSTGLQEREREREREREGWGGGRDREHT